MKNIKNKIITAFVVIIATVAIGIAAVYAITPSEIEKLNNELNENRAERKIYREMCERIPALEKRADEIKSEMFGEAK